MSRTVAVGIVFCVLVCLLPASAACETEVANALEGKFPSPTGISPNKDDSIRESVHLASIGQHVGREMLWQVLMGANLTERAITIEPGIYLDGWFGIRIEDDFLVNRESHEFLTADLPPGFGLVPN